jgi:Predicted metal-binding, possibly nucleic acid-binding protein
MFEVDIRELHRGPVDTVGTLAADDPAFQGLELDLTGPLAVDGHLQETSEGEYFWRATLAGAVRSECRRCLTAVTVPVDIDVNVMFSTDPDAADDPSVYPLPESSRTVDVRTAVREELALMVPGFPLCREDCAGLCPKCGADLNAGPCSCT